jgi:hypothetical protein
VASPSTENDAQNAAPTRHGSPAGWRRHQKAKERPCDACAKARAEYDERRRTSDAETRSARIRGRAQVRAYQRLAHEFPEKYAAYYDEAKEQVRDEIAAIEKPSTPPERGGDDG